MLSKLEKTEEIKDYRHYLSLTYKQQQLLIADWNTYFEQVKNTKASKRFWKMWPLFKLGESNEKINEWSDKARNQIKNNELELAKPFGRDPLSYVKNDIYLKYEYLRDELKKLESNCETDAREALS